MDSNQQRELWAGIWLSSKFMCIAGCCKSSNGEVDRYPEFASHLLAVDASNKKVGEVLMEAFTESRSELPEEEENFLFDPDRALRRFQNWVDALAERYGYESAQALFSDVKTCAAVVRGENIRLIPIHHDADGHWTTQTDDTDDEVIAYFDYSHEQLGGCVREVFSKDFS